MTLVVVMLSQVSYLFVPLATHDPVEVDTSATIPSQSFTTNHTLTTKLDNYRLEFLHIPKTGGTLIEVLGKEHGVAWGACKFLPPWRHRPRSKSHLKDCPTMVKPQVVTNEALWHYPIPKLQEKFPAFATDDPYDNLPPPPPPPLPSNTSSSNIIPPGQRKKFFAVIRNPYSWFISLYSMCPPCPRKESPSQYVEAYFRNKKHVAHCQYEFLYNISSPYVVDETGTRRYSKRIVEPDMVVRMEHLKEELEALWARHGYTTTTGNNVWKVPLPHERPINARKRHRVLSVRNFTKAALTLIHDNCRLDFEEGPYDMVNLEEWEDDPATMA
jgi:hypothetical protein